LEDNTYLGLVLHGEEETFHDIFVIDDEVIGLTVKTEVFLVEIDCVFATGDSEIDLVEGDNGLASK
jgi:hypothetical protein